MRAAASFVNDRQPAAREHARRLLETLKRSHVERADVENGGDAWQTHVERTLGKSVAVKIVKLCWRLAAHATERRWKKPTTTTTSSCHRARVRLVTRGSTIVETTHHGLYGY